MRLSERTYTTLSMCAGVLAALLLISFINGCGKKPAEAPATVLTTTGTATTYEIPVKQVKDKEIADTPGKDKDDTLVVVTVPASSVPTVVRVHHRPKPITKQAREIITGDKGSPDISVTSDNKDVRANAERNVGLWPYISALLVFIAGAIAARKWLKRFAWVTKAISVVRRIIGI